MYFIKNLYHVLLKLNVPAQPTPRFWVIWQNTNNIAALSLSCTSGSYNIKSNQTRADIVL